MRIIDVPIEPYEERYTEQYYRWFPKAYEQLKVEYVRIDGKALTNKVQVGSVLDVYGTHHYKYTQLAKIVKMIREKEIGLEGDVFLFHDLWFPGIEGLQYIRNMTDAKFKITGIFHAGTWDKNDFTYISGMNPWGHHIEKGWVSFVDKIFVASNYHKNLILAELGDEFYSKIVVTGLPFDRKEVSRPTKKENIVIYPHRLDNEKQPWLFDDLRERLIRKYPDWKFLKSKEVTKTKEEYYKLLGKSKIAVSYALQETFGYAMLESLANGCTPVVPNDLSYKEMKCYRPTRKFSSFDESVDIVEELMKNWQADDMKNIDINQFDPLKVIERMIKSI